MSRYDMARARPDDFQTNPWALDVLAPHLKEGSEIWECACGKGNLVEGLKVRGFFAFGSDVLTGLDFLTDRQESAYDYIVTNPPFTLKDEFLARCYELGKPFALLLPLTALEGQVRQRLYRDNGLEIVFLPKRPDFETPSGKNSGSWFAAAWFTWGLNIGQQLTFNPPNGRGGNRNQKIGASPFIARLNDRTQEILVL